MTCNLGSSVSEEFTVCVFKRLSEDGGSWFFQSSINPTAFWIEMKS
jgi:hypothetical protein